MCAILDASCVSEVFGDGRPDAGEEFFRWVSQGRGRLSVGGKLRVELGRDARFVAWAETALQQGRVIFENDDKVKACTRKLRTRPEVTSNDWHVLALAATSGARLLYSNDRALANDFRNPKILGGQRGKVYSTRGHRARGGGSPGPSGALTRNHRRMLDAAGRACLEWARARS